MIAVRAEHLSKTFRLYDKPIHRLREFFSRNKWHRDFIALEDISFELRKGGSLGLIGDNGAGKSTLLKILVGTLSPTQGQVRMNGLVSSLLELGTGFHPEISGMENIFFYGSLLGLDGSVMKKKVDEIVGFAELNDFINYPIKTYSSGMLVRLAFSVATAVDPEILIIDEALSVGDQYFQKKCIEKMAEFRNKKKTIIFCSHDMYQVKNFCERTIWLNGGKIAMFGDSGEVVNSYIAHEQMKTETEETNKHKLGHTDDEQSQFLFIRDLAVSQEDPRSLLIRCTVNSLEPFEGHLGWAILRKDQFQVSFMTTHMQGRKPFLFNGLHHVTVRLENLNIVDGTYFIYVGVFDREAFRPIAVDSSDFVLSTGYDILNSLCHFDSTFLVE